MNVLNNVFLVKRVLLLYIYAIKARATIVTLITSVDRVRRPTPECHCNPRWKNKFCSAEKTRIA